MRGKRNSKYKTGTSYAKWFREMRPIIMERESNACYRCGLVAGIKETKHKINRTRSTHAVHHIDHDPANNAAENLIYLCNSCHINYHKLNSKIALNEFSEYAVKASQSMTFRLREQATSLQTAYSSIIAM